jgi:methylated-DNA-protein-cysteine methyltransferase-like protein
MSYAFDKIYEQVRRIPKGKVATYGQIAILAGNPRWARAVGYALHVNPDPEGIPCYRVVNRFGGLAPAFAFGGINMQADLLRADGVEVREDNTVDLEAYLWDGL